MSIAKNIQKYFNMNYFSKKKYPALEIKCDVVIGPYETKKIKKQF